MNCMNFSETLLWKLLSFILGKRNFQRNKIHYFVILNLLHVSLRGFSLLTPQFLSLPISFYFLKYHIMLFYMYVILCNLKPLLYILPFLKLCLFPLEFCMKRCLIMTHDISLISSIIFVSICTRWNFFAFLFPFSKGIKRELWMLMIMEGILHLYRLLHPYFILNDIFFSRLYCTPYLMPVNSVSDLPCCLVCVFLILMSSLSVYKYNLSSLLFVREKRHAVLPFSCSLHVVMCMWNLHCGRRKCNLNIL
jgi:hypothetical protein